jgi:hypothetical protein
LFTFAEEGGRGHNMPPTTTINIDALIAALSNDKVVDAFGKMLQPMLQTMIDAAFCGVRAEVDKLTTELHARDVRVAELEKDNVELRNQTANHEQQIDALEAYSRVDNLVVYGLPESYAEAGSSSSTAVKSAMDTDVDNALELDSGPKQSEKVFLDFCHDALHVDIQSSDIYICHRLRKSFKSQHRPLIVRFTNRKTRSLVLMQKKRLRETGMKIYVSEHLTKHTSALFATARNKVKEKRLAGAWTRNGQLFVKLNQTGAVRPVKSSVELSQY